MRGSMVCRSPALAERASSFAFCSFGCWARAEAARRTIVLMNLNNLLRIPVLLFIQKLHQILIAFLRAHDGQPVNQFLPQFRISLGLGKRDQIVSVSLNKE